MIGSTFDDLWNRVKVLLELFREQGAPQSGIRVIDNQGEGDVVPTPLIAIMASALELGAAGRDAAVIRGDYPFTLDQACYLTNIQPEMLEVIARGKLLHPNDPNLEPHITATSLMEEFLDMWTLEMLGMLRELVAKEKRAGNGD